MMAYEDGSHQYCEYQFELEGDEHNKVLNLRLEVPKAAGDSEKIAQLVMVSELLASIRKIEK